MREPLEQSPLIDGLLCSPASKGRTHSTVHTQSPITGSLFHSHANANAEVLQRLGTLVEQQEILLRAQAKLVKQTEEKYDGLRRWVELLITQKEGELFLQLEQHHTEMMTSLCNMLYNKPKKDARRQLDILKNHHLLPSQNDRKTKYGGALSSSVLPEKALEPPSPTTQKTTWSPAVKMDIKFQRSMIEESEEQDFSPLPSAGAPVSKRLSRLSDGSEVSFGRRKSKQKKTMIDWDGLKLPKTWPASGQRKTKFGEDPESEEGEASKGKDGRISRMVNNVVFDAFMSVVIVLNLVVMFIQQEFRAVHTAYTLGLRDEEESWDSMKDKFEMAEYLFCGIYVIELVLRLGVQGFQYLRDCMNFIDMLIVVVTSVETFLFTSMGWSSAETNFSLARMVRLARIFRVAKIIRFARGLSELRVLVRTLAASVRALCLSMLLLSFIIMAGGILISQSLVAFMEDSDASVSERSWAYEHFGSASKATHRMFDATFTFSWVSDSRRMANNIDGALLVFWILWTLLINFTVMHVIGAIFLKQTLVISTEDADRMQLQRMELKETYAETIRHILLRADTSGDGMVTVEEFTDFIQDADVADCFAKLDLELFEVVALFRLLADENGKADYEEFLQGALKLKATASTIDAIQILHASKMIEDQIEGLAELIVGDIVVQEEA